MYSLYSSVSCGGMIEGMSSQLPQLVHQVIDIIKFVVLIILVIVGMLDLNESVEVLGYEKGLDGRGWYYVKKGNGLEGFAAAQFIDLR